MDLNAEEILAIREALWTRNSSFSSLLIVESDFLQLIGLGWPLRVHWNISSSWTKFNKIFCPLEVVFANTSREANEVANSTNKALIEIPLVQDCCCSFLFFSSFLFFPWVGALTMMLHFHHLFFVDYYLMLIPIKKDSLSLYYELLQIHDEEAAMRPFYFVRARSCQFTSCSYF